MKSIDQITIELFTIFFSLKNFWFPKRINWKLNMNLEIEDYHYQWKMELYK